MYYTYVLKNPKGILYKGHTNDLQKRINQHNNDDGFSAYTKGKGFWKLVYYEKYDTRAEAKERERFLKTGKGRDFLKKTIKDL